MMIKEFGFTRTITEFIITLIIALFITIGILITGTSLRDKVINDFIFYENFDIGWISAVVVSMIINTFTINLSMRRSEPLLNKTFNIEMNPRIDSKLIFGSLCFGLGYGLIGLDPVSILVNMYH